MAEEQAPAAEAKASDEQRAEEVKQEEASEAEQGGQDAAANEREISELKDQIDALKKENADLKNKYLYTLAETDNFKKRQQKKTQEAIDYARDKLLRDMLPVLDDFDRAVEAAATATDPKAIAEGVANAGKKFSDMLKDKYGLEPFGSAGDEYDPVIHKALTSSEGDVAVPTVNAVWQKGYKINDHVIREAQVVVSMPGSGKAEEVPDAADDDIIEDTNKGDK